MQGVDGVWLAVLIGVVVTVLGLALTGPLVRAFGAGSSVEGFATTYLRIAWLGTIPLLVMLATTGVLRGLQDTRTPLVVAVLGNGVNIVLNLLLVYGVGGFDGLGIAGSAIGTVLAQVLSALALLLSWWCAAPARPVRPWPLTSPASAPRAGPACRW